MLLIAVVVLAACSPQAVSPPATAKNPSPTTSVAATPMSTATPSATPNEVPPLILSAIQRLNQRVGYIAGWTGTGLGLAKTSDAGTTWQRLPVPVSRVTALRFINELVGWAGGFADRDVAQVDRKSVV